jgi:hypothetical protein
MKPMHTTTMFPASVQWRSLRFWLLMFAGIVSVNLTQAADILWSSSGGSAWLTGANWTGGAVPGTGDNAQFGANPTSGTAAVGINMSSTSPAGIQQVGAIEVTSARTGSLNLPVNNSSGTVAGTRTVEACVANRLPLNPLRHHRRAAHRGHPTPVSAGSSSYGRGFFELAQQCAIFTADCKDSCAGAGDKAGRAVMVIGEPRNDAPASND